MLGQVRDCGVLRLVLGWAPPAEWVRVRQTAPEFLTALCEWQVRVLASAVPKPPGDSLYEVVSIAQAHAEAASGDALVLEARVCEAAFVALWRGLPVDGAHPGTGITALMLAAEEGSLRLLQLLLARGADPDCTSIGGGTALSLALGPSCGCCQTTAQSPHFCDCPRPQVARLLLRRASGGLPEALGAAVRMALQDAAYLPLLSCIVQDKGLPVDSMLLGPDCRQGTALSCALERRVLPLEGPLVNRPGVVAHLLELRSDPLRPGPYAAWCGGPPEDGLVAFAVANRCEPATLALLRSAGASRQHGGRCPDDGAMPAAGLPHADKMAVSAGSLDAVATAVGAEPLPACCQRKDIGISEHIFSDAF